MLTKLNMYFFDQERISLSDFIWFYGFIAFMVLVTAVVIIPAQIQLFNL